MSSVLSEVNHVQFDGTLFTVHIQFTLDHFRVYWQAFFTCYSLLNDREESRTIHSCVRKDLHQGMLSKKFILRFTLMVAGSILLNELGENAKTKTHSLFQKQHQRGNIHSRTDGHPISSPPIDLPNLLLCRLLVVGPVLK